MTALDNVIWSALSTHQAPLAIGGSLARRFPIEYTPFVAMPEFAAANFEALADLVAPGEEVAMFTLHEVHSTPALEVFASRGMLQMTAQSLPPLAARSEVIPLGASDNAEMRALAEETKPGPFNSRTRELGRFLGVRVAGKLAAMTGERMHLTGYCEVTAVCVYPEFRGRGLARDLVLATAHGIQARAETPFLHVYSDNSSAIALYRSLGFAVRAELRLSRLRRTNPG